MTPYQQLKGFFELRVKFPSRGIDFFLNAQETFIPEFQE